MKLPILLASLLIAAAPATAWTENFDALVPGQYPSSPNYVYSSTTCGIIVGQTSASAPNNFLFSTGTTTACGAFIHPVAICNSGSTVKWKFKLGGNPNGLFEISSGAIANGGPPPSGGWAVNVPAGGNPVLTTYNDDGTLSHGGTMSGPTLVAGTWYSATLSGLACHTDAPLCSPDGQLIQGCPSPNLPRCNSGVTLCDDAAAYTTLTIDGIGSIAAWAPNIHVANNRANDRAFSAFATGGTYYIDDLEITDPPPAVTSTTVATPSLAGYAMDPFAGFIVARHSGAQPTVKTYDGQTLALLASTSNACNRMDGVMAYQKASGSMFTGFLECNGSGQTYQLKIRSHQLTAPDVSGTQCAQSGTMCNESGDYYLQQDNDGANYPLSNCNGQNTQDFPPQAGQLGSIQAMPISYENGRAGEYLVNDKVAVGFAYVNIANTAQGGGGNLGVFVDRLINKETDKSCGLEVPFTTPSTASSICTWRDVATKLDYIAGASSAAGKVWKVDIDPQFGAVLHEPPEVTINLVHALPAPYNSLSAVACAQSTDIIVMTMTGDVYRLSVTGPTVDRKWGPVKAGAATTRGLAFSGDGKWYAYAKGTDVIVGDAATGATATTVSMPAGGFTGVSLDDTGQVVYIVTNANIKRAVIYSATTKTPVAEGTRCTGTDCHLVAPDGTSVTPGGTGNGGSSGLPGINPGDMLKPSIDGMKSLFGAAGPWILGLILIVALGAFGMYKWGKGIGITLALLGLAISVAVGFIDLWFLAVFILLCAAAFVMKQRMWSLS